MSIKGVICVFFCMISLMCVSGCAGTNQGKTEVNGKTTEYKIDEETKTIEIASEVYKYEKNGNQLIFTYPNDEQVTIDVGSKFDAFECSIAYNTETISEYVSPENLYDIYQSNQYFSIENIYMIILGICLVAFPRLFYAIRYGWAVGMENCGLAVKLTRFIGIIVIVMGLLL